jgi:hypothetical protein
MSANVLELKDTLFNEPDFEENVLRFASDIGCQVVYIVKDRVVTLEDDGGLHNNREASLIRQHNHPQHTSPTACISPQHLPILPTPFRPSH